MKRSELKQIIRSVIEESKGLKKRKLIKESISAPYKDKLAEFLQDGMVDAENMAIMIIKAMGRSDSDDFADHYSRYYGIGDMLREQAEEQREEGDEENAEYYEGVADNFDTNALYDAIENEYTDWESVAKEAISYIDEDTAKYVVTANELEEDEEEDYEDEPSEEGRKFSKKKPIIEEHFYVDLTNHDLGKVQEEDEEYFSELAGVGDIDEEGDAEYYDFKIPVPYVTAFEYGEYDGLDQDEIDAIEGFMQQIEMDNPESRFSWQWGEDEYFSHTNDVTGRIGSNVVDAKLYIL